LVGLFVALRYLVVLLKALVLGRSEGAFDRFIFGKPLVAMAFGVLLTFFVQSSSVTTSLVIPLIGAGILTVRQVFPYMLGANIGTTLTALLAALALAATATGVVDVGHATLALEVAFVHVLFNVFGVALIYPVRFIREVPIRMAEFIGDLAFKNRFYAIAYLVGLFYLLPLVLELLMR
jgi:sodium-dependent phosphate cotransporter